MDVGTYINCMFNIHFIHDIMSCINIVKEKNNKTSKKILYSVLYVLRDCHTKSCRSKLANNRVIRLCNGF
jgi:hypothetical protein